MCSTPKVREVNTDNEIIKSAVQADASTQKASAGNRAGVRGIVSENIKTSAKGLDEEIKSYKKRLLGE